MDCKCSENKYFIRIDKNEEIVDSLKQFCKQNNVSSGYFTGLGAVKSATFGFFDPEKKQYFEKTFDKYMELTSLVGNTSKKDGAPYLHAHASVADKNYEIKGGHLARAIVSATCEIVFIESDCKVSRKFDDEVGLNLFDFSLIE